VDKNSEGLLDFLSKFNPLTADYRKEEPTSVKTMRGATALTPLDSVVEIGKELKKEEPDYKKIGLLTAMEAAGAIAPMAKPAAMAIKSGKKGKTVKAYKLFSKGEDGKLYPLFVDADAEVPIGKTLKATFPEYRFKAKNGNFYVPSRGPKKAKGTGDMIEIPDQETRDMLIDAGFLPKGSKAKSIRAVAARPGWHAGDNPTAPHIGPETKIDGKKYKIRGDNQVWAEVEMPDDIDWQAIADSRAVMKKDGTPNVKTAHITDELPFGGHYRYKTNPNMQGNWLISGDMKVIRELDKDEVKRLNKAAGVEDLPTLEELEQQIGIGLASGGIIGDNMYKGVDDYLMSEMDVGMAKGGLPEQMEMSFGEIPDNTVGVDPVSGNEIPLGSSAKEVRDDIPAQLSEGEMVIPADVVRFFGVKFFEDIRQAAKIGYAKMDEDGRIGGEPIPMEDESGLGLEMADLEVMDMGDDSDEMMEEPEEAFLGKFFAGIRESNRKQAEKNKQSVRDRFQAAKDRGSSSKQISKRVQAKKDKPKNRYEQIREQMKSAFRDDDDNRSRNRRVTLDRKPPTSDDTRGPSLAEQINFGGDFSGNKETKKASPTREAGQVEEAYTGQNLRSDKGFGQRFMEGLGYDEGGDVVDPDTDVVQEGTTGGFGEEIGLDQGVFGGEMEAREYQNAAGHKIIIMFLDGEPMQDIPAGYYPVGSEPVTVDPGEQPSGGGGSDDDDDGPDMPEPFSYKELTIDELSTEVKNLKSPPPFGLGALGVVLSLAQKNHNKKTVEEINRRLEATDLPIYEREYLENLKEVAEGPQQKGVVGKLIDDITGKEVEDPDLPKLDGPTYDMLPDQYGVTEAYTPETKTPETTTGFSPEILEQIEKASAEAAAKAFSGYKAPGTEKDDDDDKGSTIKPPAPTYTQPGSDPYAEPGRPTSSNNNDDDDDGPTFAPPPPPPSYTKPSEDPYAEPGRPTSGGGGRRTYGGGGKNQGGLMKSKKKKATKKKK